MAYVLKNEHHDWWHFLKLKTIKQTNEIVPTHKSVDIILYKALYRAIVWQLWLLL